MVIFVKSDYILDEAAAQNIYLALEPPDMSNQIYVIESAYSETKKESKVDTTSTRSFSADDNDVILIINSWTKATNFKSSQKCF